MQILTRCLPGTPAVGQCPSRVSAAPALQAEPPLGTDPGRARRLVYTTGASVDLAVSMLEVKSA